MPPRSAFCRRVVSVSAGAWIVATVVWLSAPGGRAAEPPRETFAGRLEFDGKSAYSHIRVRVKSNVRSLIFVRDTGEEALESRIHIERPYVLQFDYLKHLFTSYLFVNPQEDVLIVGLGGGGMVHFLRRYDPALRIDAVEIDPLVVELAAKYFGVASGPNVNVVVGDGLKFIAEGDKRYDVIYLDAFLKPSGDTDATGTPLALKTQEFYKQIQARLKPGGVAAFNINPHAQADEDVKAIAAAFPQAYEFFLPRDQGRIVVAATNPTRIDEAELLNRAAAMDERFRGALPFREMARRLR
jgi:spermidine synthase